MKTRLVVFDLDETLVHATESPLATQHLTILGDYFVYERPFARELLSFTASHFHVALWSSASAAYVQGVAKRLVPDDCPLVVTWTVEKCVQRPDPTSGGYVYIKDLRKFMSLGYDPEEVVMVDDSKEKVIRQPRSHMLVAPFEGDPSDRELLKVKEMLMERLRFARGESAL